MIHLQHKTPTLREWISKKKYGPKWQTYYSISRRTSVNNSALDVLTIISEGNVVCLYDDGSDAIHNVQHIYTDFVVIKEHVGFRGNRTTRLVRNFFNG